MRNCNVLVALVLSFFLIACGSKPVEKRFPGGDLYDEKPRDILPEILGENDRVPIFQPIHLPTNKREEKGLVLTMKLDRIKVSAGSRLPVTMIVRNTTSASLPLTYANAQRFDIVVFAKPGQKEPVFVWSKGQVFSQFFQEEMLGGGSIVTRVLEIPTTSKADVARAMKTDLSSPLPPGTYYLWGTHEGEPFLAHGPIEFVIEE